MILAGHRCTTLIYHVGFHKIVVTFLQLSDSIVDQGSYKDVAIICVKWWHTCILYMRELDIARFIVYTYACTHPFEQLILSENHACIPAPVHGWHRLAVPDLVMPNASNVSSYTLKVLILFRVNISSNPYTYFIVGGNLHKLCCNSSSSLIWQCNSLA